MQLRLASIQTSNIMDSIRLDIKANVAESCAKIESSRGDVVARLDKIDHKFNNMSENFEVKYEKNREILTEQTMKIQKLAQAIGSLQSSVEKLEENQAGLFAQLLTIYSTMKVS